MVHFSRRTKILFSMHISRPKYCNDADNADGDSDKVALDQVVICFELRDLL